MSTSGGYHEYIGGYHDACGEQVDKSLLISTENSDVLKILKCTHDIPAMYSWYLPMYWTSPDVFMVSPDVLMVSPDVLMVSPDVLNIPQCIEHTLYRVNMKNRLIDVCAESALDSDGSGEVR